MRLRLEGLVENASLTGMSHQNTANPTREEVQSDGSAAAWIPPLAIASDLSTGLARRKRWHHKTRSGCLTCRRRRVKCDEQRPSCLRCCKAKQSCRYEDRAPLWSLIHYQPSSLPSGSDKFDLSLLNFFLQNTKHTLSIRPSLFSDDSQMEPFNPDTATARFWNSVGLPLVHTEPLILELVVLLARRHRMTLEQPNPSDEDLLRVIEVVSQIAKTRPQDIVVVGSMLASSFQVLHSTLSKNHTASENGVHAIAFSKLLLNSSDTVFEYVKPVTDATRVTLAICSRNQDDRSLDIPEIFSDFEEARYYFAEILKLKISNLRPALEKWLGVMSDMYEHARGKDWEGSKTIYTLFFYGQHLLMISDLTLSVNPELEAAWDAVEERARCSPTFYIRPS